MEYKIYISEDEPPILRDIIHKIESMGLGFQIVGHAANGEDAYKEIIALRPDLVITDIRMPVLDGLALIQMVKSDFPDMMCLILSGFKDFEYARQALKLGVD
ncbi:MAG TPA: response regulator, partial [Bacilli bacterium]